MTGMTPAIYVSLGNKRYAGGTISETSGKDISGATFGIALSSDPVVPPVYASFGAPDVSVQGATTADRVVKKLVDSGTSLGTFAVWGRVMDNPEIEPILLDWPIVVA